MEVQPHAFLTSASDGDEWDVEYAVRKTLTLVLYKGTLHFFYATLKVVSGIEQQVEDRGLGTGRNQFYSAGLRAG
jgi:hypothetical protein